MAAHSISIDPDKQAKLQGISDVPAIMDDTANKILDAEKEQTEVILSALEQLAKVLSAPRELVRDKQGKPIGSRVVQQ